MKTLSVGQLMLACQLQIKKGNGDKEVWISSDDEGNSYHGLYYSFLDDEHILKEIENSGMADIGYDPATAIVLG